MDAHWLLSSFHTCEWKHKSNVKVSLFETLSVCFFLNEVTPKDARLIKELFFKRDYFQMCGIP